MGITGFIVLAGTLNPLSVTRHTIHNPSEEQAAEYQLAYEGAQGIVEVSGPVELLTTAVELLRASKLTTGSMSMLVTTQQHLETS